MSTHAKPVLSIRSLLLAVRNAWENRRVVGQLGGLDDHMLRDIGITRQDVASVLAEPLFRDPSQKLAERARATRVASRASAHDFLMAEKALEVAASSAAASRHRAEPRRAA